MQGKENEGCKKSGKDGIKVRAPMHKERIKILELFHKKYTVVPMPIIVQKLGKLLFQTIDGHGAK